MLLSRTCARTRSLLLLEVRSTSGMEFAAPVCMVASGGAGRSATGGGAGDLRAVC